MKYLILLFALCLPLAAWAQSDDNDDWFAAYSLFAETTAKAGTATTSQDSSFEKITATLCTVVVVKGDTAKINYLKAKSGGRITVLDTTEFRTIVIIETTSTFNHSISVTGNIRGDSLKMNYTEQKETRLLLTFPPGGTPYPDTLYATLDYDSVGTMKPGGKRLTWLFQADTNNWIGPLMVRIPDSARVTDTLVIGWWCYAEVAAAVESSVTLGMVWSDTKSESLIGVALDSVQVDSFALNATQDYVCMRNQRLVLSSLTGWTAGRLITVWFRRVATSAHDRLDSRLRVLLIRLYTIR